MQNYLKFSSFSVSLGLTAHRQAIADSQDYNNDVKMQQIYLNTLAIYAVNFYLKTQGFSPDLENCDSQDDIKRTLLDVADLHLKNCGYIECRPILADANFLYVPADVWSGRIAYVAVEIDADLTQAKLLGFVKQVKEEKVSLTNLQSLEELIPYLQRQQASNPKNILDRALAAGKQLGKTWSSSPTLEPAFSFRGGSSPDSSSGLEIRQIVLGSGENAIGLIVTFLRANNQQRHHLINIKSAEYKSYIPAKLHLTILDETDTIIMEAHAKNETEIINFEFGGETGDRFRLRLSWGKINQVEQFMI